MIAEEYNLRFDNKDSSSLFAERNNSAREGESLTRDQAGEGSSPEANKIKITSVIMLQLYRIFTTMPYTGANSPDLWGARWLIDSTHDLWFGWV